MYGLYDDERFTPEEKAAFVGRKMMARLTKKYFKDSFTAITTDKIVFRQLLEQRGVPGPKTHAIYFRKPPKTIYDDVEVICGTHALADYLRHRAPYPMFSKPVNQVQSLGIAAVDYYDFDGDNVVLADGRIFAMAQYLAAVENYAKTGYMFQERLAPHPVIEAMCGTRICTARIMVIMEDGVPTILRASSKIPAGRNQADNFWRADNILGGIDIDSGTIFRAIQQGGPREVEADSHPDTGTAIKGLTLPDLVGAKSLCINAAQEFPDSPVQGWDMAFCAAGPLVLEVEGNGGHPVLTQLPLGRGWLDDRFRAHLKKSMAAARR
ncbi:MAG: sugar-transfer associated ATP-grasp domain-containing protein [Alphaproteobacteria bacterium]